MIDPSLNDIQAELHALRARLAELETKLSYLQSTGDSGRERQFLRRLGFRFAPLAGLLLLTGGALYAGSAGESLFINPQGNVGIGTTSPKNALDVNGGLAIGTNYAGSQSAPANGTVIEGRVGIGTTAPSAKLEVNLANTRGWEDKSPGIRLTAPDHDYTLDVNTYIVHSGNVGYQFSPSRTKGASIGLNITTHGHVGIGTQYPKNALDVNGGLAIGANYAGHQAAPVNGAIIEGAAHVGSLSIADAQGKPYKDNWIGMANNLGDERPWLHIGGITDDREKVGDQKRRIVLYAHETHVHGDLAVNGSINVSTQKVCSIIGDGKWRDSLPVPRTWTKSTCQELRNKVAGTVYQLACLSTNGFSFGTDNGGIPSPNCGWE